MNIVMISGGLGNQMFQYALCIAMKKNGVQVKIDNSKYNYYQIHNNYELERVFEIKEEIASTKEIRQYGYLKDNKLTRFLRKTPFRKRSSYNETNMGFNENVLKIDEKYIYGYWQNERYFLEFKDIVFDKFRFPQFNSERLRNFASQIENCNSISIHIRRGDYLKYPLYKGICNKLYYEHAIKFILDSVGKNVTFFVFSNDMKWVKENLKIEHVVYVEGNDKNESYRDMQLMTICKHNIIANSSFSWWGAWLNQNADKIVVAPTKWTNDERKVTNEIVPDKWIGV